VSEPASATVGAGQDEEDIAEEGSGEDIVRVKRFPMKPMTVDEALEQVELLGHDFFMFYNADERHYGVLYKRNDGGYGLILPEGP